MFSARSNCHTHTSVLPVTKRLNNEKTDKHSTCIVTPVTGAHTQSHYTVLPRLNRVNKDTPVYVRRFHNCELQQQQHNTSICDV